MPNGDLTATLRARMADLSRNPEQMRLYKLQLRERLKSMTPADRDWALKQLSNITEIQDVTQEFQAPPKAAPSGWQRALGVVTYPIRQVEEKFAQPVARGLWAAGVSVMPGEQSGEAELRKAISAGQWSPWHKGYKEAYEAAETPPLVKGTLEFLPWLAFPSAAGVAGKLGQAAKVAGPLGRAAGIAEKAVRPVATAERLAMKPVEILARPLTKMVKKPVSRTERFLRQEMERERFLRELKIGQEFDFIDKTAIKVTRGKIMGTSLDFEGEPLVHIKDLKTGRIFKVGDEALRESYGIPLPEQVKEIIERLESDIRWAKGSRFYPPTPAIEADARAGLRKALKLQEDLQAKGIPGVEEKAARPLTQAAQGSLSKLVGLVEKAKPTPKATAIARHKELQARVARVGKALEEETGEEAFIKARAALKGELPKGKWEAPIDKMVPEDIFNLKEAVRTANFQPLSRLTAEEGLAKLLVGTDIAHHEAVLLEQIFGPDLIKAFLKRRPWREKAYSTALSLLGVPKALVASFDLSAPGRQGIIMITSKEWWTSWKPMIKALASEDAARSINKSILQHADYPLLERAKLYIAPYGEMAAGGLARREEAFMTTFTKWLPWVKLSERSYVTYLNKLRSDTFYRQVRWWRGQGLREEEIAAKAERWAGFINKATGRGTLPGVRGELPAVLNAAFFSPRFVASRFQVPFTIFQKDPEVRKLIAKQLAGFVGAGLGALAIAKAAGAEVEVDPRSSNFGKVRLGNMRIDFWGGMQPLARYSAQFLQGYRKTEQGEMQKVRRLDTAQRFMMSKLSPAAGLVMDALQGTNFIGQPLEFTTESAKREALNRLTPMFIQDMLEAFNEEGLVGLPLASIAGAGIGVQTYREIPTLAERIGLEDRQIQAEMVRLRVPPGTVSGTIEGKEITGEQKKLYQETADVLAKPLLPALMKHKDYQALGDEERRYALDYLMGQVREEARNLVFERMRPETSAARMKNLVELTLQKARARTLLKPYWAVEERIWSQSSPQLRQIANEIKSLEGTDPAEAKRRLRQYPQIVFIRQRIAQTQKAMRDTQPAIRMALRLF